MSAWWFVVMLGVVVVGHGDAQQLRDQSTRPIVGTGVLTGIVTTAGDSPVPLRRAVVSVSGEPLRTNLLAVTDANGRFEFRNLPPGRFTVDARKAGFVPEVYGAVSTGSTVGVPVPIGDGTTTVAMSLVRGAVISGHIRMPAGAPVSSIRLQVLRWDTVRGRRQLVSARGGAYGVSAEGRYRIGGLPPGEYVIVAYPFGRVERRLFDPDGPGAVVSFAPVYLPGTTDAAQATALRLEAGDERVVDLMMEFVETGRVDGRVLGPDAAPMAGAQVSFLSGLPAVSQSQPVRTAADGTFVSPSLVPGTYTVVARGAPAGLPPAASQGSLLASQPQLPLWAQTSLTVVPGGLQRGLDLHLQPGRAVRGRFVLASGTEALLNVSSLMVRLEADEASTTAIGVPVVAPGADRTFEVPGVAPGQYQLHVIIPAALQNAVFVVGMDSDGRDVLDGPVTVGLDRDVAVTVALTNNPSVVTVTARGSEGLLLAGQPVVVFPRDPTLRVSPSRRVAITRTGADGVTDIRALPDGEYLVAALSSVPEPEAMTAQWFEVLAASASTVTVRDGHQVTVTLTVTR